MPARDEIPDTVKRSSAKAQRTWAKTHDSAVESYGEGERAHRTAYASLKHSFKKVRDRWEEKDEKGPSDPRSTKTGAEAGTGKGKTFGGIDFYGSTKQELYQQAAELGVTGRSKMTKEQLAEAISKKS